MLDGVTLSYSCAPVNAIVHTFNMVGRFDS
jgi:hypothetical protein